ncbi:PREDICTED: uncharacterized protein KIAA1958-like [Eurypyga helias]|uniref:uncharacterized protein KIAA1958-like n=1 Tax=Eurypyga helias TaxID=54383 RepID=UPI0005294EA9|nr:PREDICTED: uncharacterized protein KIAA1958-like [Eurypyga helias]
MYIDVSLSWESADRYAVDLILQVLREKERIFSHLLIPWEIENGSMNKGVVDGNRIDTGSLHRDLSNLVTWAHTHGTICSHIPALETGQSVGHPGKENSVLWICSVGHAYHWQCGRLCVRSGEKNKAREKRKSSASAEALLREADSEKRLRKTPSFERAEGDAVRTGSYGGSPGLAQRKDNTVYVIRNEPSPGKNKNSSKSVRSYRAAEQCSPVPSGRIKTNRRKVNLESHKEPQSVLDEGRCASDGNDQGDRVNQNVPSASPVKGVAEAELQMHPMQEGAFNKLTATQTPGFDPTGKPPPALACIQTLAISNQESLDNSFLSLGSLNPSGSATEASDTWNSSGSATPKELVRPVPVSGTEAKAQPDSPISMTLLEFEVITGIHQKPQPCPPECSTTGISLRESPTQNPMEESEPSGSGHAPHCSASVSLESNSADQPPASSNKSVQKKGKKNRNSASIKPFKDWLVLHRPSETREIHTLPPEDLDTYLALFFRSVKRQDGMDLSASSLHYFQGNMERYLRDHSYRYSVKGFQFRASQEALREKYQYLSQKERGEEWSILEKLTDEDVANLCEKGILSKAHPRGFLHLLFTNIVRGFGARTHSQSPSVYWGQLVLRKGEGELEYLEWKDDLSTEGNAGQEGPRLFARPDNPDSCPVTDYKEYARKRPLDKLHDYDPLYLAPMRLWSSWDKAWYCRKSLTKAQIEKMLKTITQQVKGSGKKSRK